MHTFIDNIITFSLRNKFFIFFCTTITVIAGITSFIHTPIDAFPDVTNTKVSNRMLAEMDKEKNGGAPRRSRSLSQSRSRSP